MPQRSMVTRSDALTFLDASKDKGDALRALAADPDPRMRALVVGPWGRRYAAAHGLPAATMTLLQHDALTATAKDVGPEARAAVAAIAAKGAPVGSAVSLAKMILNG